MIIEIPLVQLPPSPNRTKGQHWATRARSIALYRDLAFARGQQARGRTPKATTKQACLIEIILPLSRRGPVGDPDSALARVKPLIDGIVDAGCLRGDKPADVVYAPVEQRKEGTKLMVRFTLADVESLDRSAASR